MLNLRGIYTTSMLQKGMEGMKKYGCIQVELSPKWVTKRIQNKNM